MTTSEFSGDLRCVAILPPVTGAVVGTKALMKKQNNIN